MFLAVATFAFASIVGAADFPKGAISIVVPAAPGGGTDLSARVFAKYAQKVLGQPVVVVNVSGGGGSSGTKKVYDAKPDGANILFFHNNVVLNNISGVASYSYDGFEVGPRMVTDAAMGLFVNKSSGWNTINDFIEYCGQNPGKATVATEIGGYTYFFLLSLQDKTGVEFNIVDAAAILKRARRCSAATSTPCPIRTVLPRGLSSPAISCASVFLLKSGTLFSPKCRPTKSRA